jgi:hypothetical protein
VSEDVHARFCERPWGKFPRSTHRLLGFVGPKEEAEEIKGCLSAFLRETLKLELSQEKTLITHATTGAARFLGYEIVTHQADEKRDQAGHRTLNGHIGLRMPNEVVEKKRA